MRFRQAQRVMGAVENEEGSDAESERTESTLKLPLGSRFVSFAAAAFLCAFAGALVAEMAAYEQGLFRPSFYSWYRYHLFLEGPVQLWALAAAVLSVLVTITAGLGLLSRRIVFRWLAFGVCVHWAIIMLQYEIRGGGSSYIGKYAVAEWLSDDPTITMTARFVLVIGFLVVAGAAWRKGSRGNVGSARHLPLYVCLLFVPATVLLYYCSYYTYSSNQSFYHEIEASHRLLICAGFCIVLMSTLAAVLPRVASITVVLGLGIAVYAVYSLRLLNDTWTAYQTWQLLSILLAGLAPLAAHFWGHRFRALLKGGVERPSERLGPLERVALLRTDGAHRLMGVFGVALGAALCLGAILSVYVGPIQGVLADFDAGYRPMPAAKMALGLFLCLVFYVGGLVALHALRVALALPERSVSRVSRVLALCALGLVSMYLLSWALLDGALMLEAPNASPNYAFLVGIGAWILAGTEVPRTLKSAIACLQARISPLIEKKAHLGELPVFGRYRLSGTVAAMGEVLANQRVYLDDLNLPEPTPKGLPFFLQEGADKVLVEFDPGHVKIIATPDDDGLIKIEVGSKVTVVGDLRGGEDPYRHGLTRVIASEAQPLLILADAAGRNRRLLAAATVELVASTAFLGTGIMLIVVRLLVGT